MGIAIMDFLRIYYSYKRNFFVTINDCAKLKTIAGMFIEV